MVFHAQNPSTSGQRQVEIQALQLPCVFQHSHNGIFYVQFKQKKLELKSEENLTWKNNILKANLCTKGKYWKERHEVHKYEMKHICSRSLSKWLQIYFCTLLTCCMWVCGPLDVVMKGPGKPAREMFPMYLWFLTWKTKVNVRIWVENWSNGLKTYLKHIYQRRRGLLFDTTVRSMSAAGLFLSCSHPVA